MFHRKAVIGGLVGGALGALLWAVVVVVTEYEIGWIAWAVGAMVGYGVGWGNRGVEHDARAAGLLAVVITILAIPAGKYAAVRILIPDDAELMELLVADYMTEEFVISYVADEVVSELNEAGETVAWPADADPMTAAAEPDYPSRVWSEAETRWTAMSPAEKADYRYGVEANITANLAPQLPLIRRSIEDGVFLRSFAAMDVVFFGLAMVTAFGLAGGNLKTEGEVAIELREAVRLAMIEVMLADGEADEQERAVARQIYRSMTGFEMSDDGLRREIADAMASGTDVPHMLAALAPRLGDHGKGIVIRAAYLVARASEDCGPEERRLIAAIGDSLGLEELAVAKILTRLLEEEELAQANAVV